MLQVPNNGENILNWARQATKEINSNIIHNGIGIRVLRSPQGTNLSITSVKKTTSAVDGYNMPFDVIDGGEDSTLSGSTSRVFKIMTCGPEANLMYTIGKKTRRIMPFHSEFEVTQTVTLPVEDGARNYIVVVLQYPEDPESGNQSQSQSESGTEESDKFPYSYTFDTEDDLTQEDVISDEDGFKIIPIAYVQKLKDPEEDEGGDEGESEVEGGEGGEGGDEPEPEPEEEFGGAYRTLFTQNEKRYALVQLYHGEIHLFWKGSGSLSTCSVGRVQSGEGGTFSVYLEEWDGNETELRVCACDLACTSYIPADTKIIAHPIETRYIGE